MYNKKDSFSNINIFKPIKFQNIMAGYIHSIIGPMFSGKTTELMKEYRVLNACENNMQFFKSKLDDRYSIGEASTHDKTKIKAEQVDTTKDITKLLNPETKIITIDELGFLDDKIIGFSKKFADKGGIVLASYLNLDIKGMPFGFFKGKKTVADFLAISDRITKLNARCKYVIGKNPDGSEKYCGEEASFTKYFGKGNPDPKSPELIGGKEKFGARCREHYSLKEAFR